ncbi:D-ribose pyranase [Enterococcus sp. ZJ1668]|uniref:D-ribose pyranase n=1 Tax=Enterococcus sp. ZJ1668 TaxID=2709402 RepID=UPI0013ECDE40|nr:D-ribose pyranase [Enterococcus sp. ZJ1668]
MKKGKVINSDISRVISQMGHFDKLSIGDAGMPVPSDTEKIDLAVSNGLPGFIDVLENVLEELEVQSIELAEEIKTMNPAILEKIKEIMPETPITFIPHEEMKKDLTNCHAFIRTGEMTPYANIILVSGVVF